MNKYKVVVWLYCYVNYKNPICFPWRKMKILAEFKALTAKDAHRIGELLCDKHQNKEEPLKRAVMYEII